MNYLFLGKRLVDEQGKTVLSEEGDIIVSEDAPAPPTTVKTAFLMSIGIAINDLIATVNNIIQARLTGYGARIWNDFTRIYLSGNEEAASYELTQTVPEIEANLIPIHQARGTEPGITNDVKRICNNAEPTVQFYGQDSVGWITDKTAPEFIDSDTYNPDDSLCYLDIDNMVRIVAQNKGLRNNAEVEKIIRREFTPVTANLQLRITKQ